MLNVGLYSLGVRRLATVSPVNRGIFTLTYLAAGCGVVQVFEYLDTDLKKYMDRTGRGPSNPLPKETVRVSATELNILCGSFPS
jgi:hypothetical protein